MDQIFDLFGMPIPKGHGKRGRPEHIVTLENRNKVNMLIAFGWSNERIANAIGISLPTFRKNYFQELRQREFARDRHDAKVMMTLWQLGVVEGNVAAIKEYDRRMEKIDAMAADRAFQGEREIDELVVSKLGKKEAAEVAAQTAGENSLWGDDLNFRQRVN